MKKAYLFISKEDYQIIINNLITVINNTAQYEGDYRRLIKTYKTLKTGDILNNYEEFQAITDEEERLREEIMRRAEKVFKRLGLT